MTRSRASVDPSARMTLDLQFCTFEPEMAAAWESAFRGVDVTIRVDDILGSQVDAILSPANSFGFMDGGIDLLYSRFFGPTLQDDLQALIASRHDGELPVGQAVVVATGHATIPFLVSAPTMRVPCAIDRTVHPYLAFRASLIAVRAHNAVNHRKIMSLASPALGAGIGAMPFGRVARQMFAAYSEVVLGDTGWRDSSRGILRQHAALLE